MIQALGVIASCAAAAGGAGLAVAGNALFDFALNPRAKHSIMARINDGEVTGVDAAAMGSDPALTDARRWFEQSKRDISIRPHDGGELHGWRIWGPGVIPGDDGRRDGASPDIAHRYLILCHGYSGQPSDLAREARAAHGMGCSVLLPAARGFERNRDRYVGMGWLDARDLLGWIDALVAFDPQARIGLFGVSMGAAEVMMASGAELPDNVRCIVADCGYTSVWDEFVVQMNDLMHLPIHPLLDAAEAVCRVRAGYGFKEASAVKRLARARVPMLFIHGTDDVFVPFRMLDEVYSACASPIKEKAVFEGAGHGACSYADPVRYRNLVLDFLTRYL